MPLEVLYEDNHLIAVLKPAGLLTQGDESGAPNLLDQVKDYLRDKYQKPGNIFLGLLHRLDRPVSGIVLLAKTSKGAARVSEQIRNRTFKKIYQAEVEGEIKPKRAELKNFLIKDEEERKAKVVTTGGDEAILKYEVLKSEGDYTWLKIELVTGRFHQIRAQLAHIGHPIVGDKKYGSKTIFPDGQINLWATEVSFTTATTNEVVSLKINPNFIHDRHI